MLTYLDLLSLCSSMKKDLAICEFYKWFAFAVQKWLRIAKHKAYKRIQKAVELDKVLHMAIHIAQIKF